MSGIGTLLSGSYIGVDIGLLSALTIIAGYAFAVELDWGGHTLPGQSSIVSITTPSKGHPVYWYLGVMWFNFSPGPRCCPSV